VCVFVSHFEAADISSRWHARCQVTVCRTDKEFKLIRGEETEDEKTYFNWVRSAPTREHTRNWIAGRSRKRELDERSTPH